jgi:cellobiose phosphorylase
MSASQLNDPAPHGWLLSNGSYTVLLTEAGSGYSAYDGYALTNWAGDRTRDADGVFVYLRDRDRDHVWSVGHQPVRASGDRYALRYGAGRVSFERADGGIEARLDICVAPRDPMEIRRLNLHNAGAGERRLEITSYLEVALNHAAAHAAHPAFSKLFVQTDWAAEAQALLARRRPRSHAESHPWMVHALVAGGDVQYETDRARFVGRGHTVAFPAALRTNEALSGSIGNVLDPIFGLRRFVQLGPGQAVDLTLLLGAAATPAEAVALVRKYGSADATEAAFAGAAEQERALLRQCGLTEAESEHLQDRAVGMLYGDAALRADQAVIRRARGSPSALRRYGLETDGLLAVARVDGLDRVQVARDLFRAAVYWGHKGLRVQVALACGEDDLVLGAIAQAREEIAGGGASLANIVTCRRADMPEGEIDLMEAAAHLVVDGAVPERGGKSRIEGSAPGMVRIVNEEPSTVATPAARDAAREEPLLFDNGYGGFAAGGREYVIRLQPGAEGELARPPMPWINVVANQRFGFLASECGAGYTWSRNSRENRLTPWSNDPIGDPCGEAVYVCDLEAGTCWSPLPSPAPGAGGYECRHGFGYTSWRHRSHDLRQETTLFVPRSDPVKITWLRLANESDRPRRLAICCYQQLVLGEHPNRSGRFVVTEHDRELDAVLARNALNDEFAGATVFAAAAAPGAPAAEFTADRADFLGKNGDLKAPAALKAGKSLDGRAGAALDPCIALRVVVELAPGASAECVFLLGEGVGDAEARELIGRYRRTGAAAEALEDVRHFWEEVLSAVQVRTPSAAIDLMLNGWLLYQTLACRLWARSAFYQSGGAFGFRDQLQDSMALVYARPEVTRAQILLHAAHQFEEGDVLHWWHPPAGRGTRTRFSDDLLWLPYVTGWYIRATGDDAILDARVGFVSARALEPREDEAYLQSELSAEETDLYDHCCRALDRSLNSGAHDLPLMGSGDWNDGMNRVGREGRGESVWLGFFLYRVLDQFTPFCEQRGDRQRVDRYRAYQSRLRAALETHGWDGAWYRRAYYDDGTPLGSAQNQECRIDALAQAWAVISNAASRERAAQAMDAVEEHLVDNEAGIIRLLAPPFDADPHDPGYIKGYVPGIRENGGQYTHAALWVVQAIAELGRRQRAAVLFEMLAPIRHSATAEKVAVYQVEPYVVAADVYGVKPHVGRGGWTWYTGSAGWMYRIGVESILGFRLEGGTTLVIQPCVPDDWPQLTIRYRLPDDRTEYEIVADNPKRRSSKVCAVSVDGRPGVVENAAARIPIIRDGRRHQVRLTLGE